MCSGIAGFRPFGVVLLLGYAFVPFCGRLAASNAPRGEALERGKEAFA